MAQMVWPCIAPWQRAASWSMAACCTARRSWVDPFQRGVAGGGGGRRAERGGKRLPDIAALQIRFRQEVGQEDGPFQHGAAFARRDAGVEVGIDAGGGFRAQVRRDLSGEAGQQGGGGGDAGQTGPPAPVERLAHVLRDTDAFEVERGKVELRVAVACLCQAVEDRRRLWRVAGTEGGDGGGRVRSGA
ncbi:MAG: hypothetical protein Q27BPR15_03715 [Rhodobacter sp. CACIA14H1]|nr:MAG: hypothetical protein Q27BPR15_03715 [Rhodobacter sp. CACIA14H1]